MDGRSIDWEAIRTRLEAATADASAQLELDPIATRRILEARARVAARPEAAPDEAEQVELLAFSIGGDTYGVETLHVAEVCRVRGLTGVPGTPSFVAGVMDLRGRVLALVDLNRFLDVSDGGAATLDQVIVLRGSGAELGLLAEAVQGVISVATSDLQPGLAAFGSGRERFIRGMTGRLLTVLDGGRLLTDDALKVGGQAAG